MKKIITSLVALSLIFCASAQDGDVLKNKKGTPILPKAGDFALQMNANPLLDFGLNAVNIMNNTGQTSAHPGFTAGQDPAISNYIVGKYFLSSSTALRLRAGYTSSIEKEETYGDNPINPSNATPSNILLSTEREKERGFHLGGGIEFRRGYGRLQGYYGGELNLTLSSSKSLNEYEIAYNQQAQDSGYIAVNDTRDLETSSGLSFGLGFRGFVGVEYFILAKISIGAEFGLGWDVATTPRGETSTESWRGTGNFDSNGVEVNGTFTDKSDAPTRGSDRGFTTDQGLGAASLNITFHF